MDFPPIETDRLKLRTLAPSDVAEVYAHFSDPEVMRFITDTEPCASLADAAEIIAFHERDSGCRYGLFLEPAGTFIGTCGFHCWRETPVAIAEVGYDLSPAYWGRGLMREAMTVLLDYGFESMGLSEIEATSAVENARSRTLLRRLGFVEDSTQRHGEVRCLLRREDWRGRER